MVKSATTLLLASTVALGLPAFGQDRLGSIQGTVKDPSGAHVPGARVEVTGPATKRSSVADARGAFTIDTNSWVTGWLNWGSGAPAGANTNSCHRRARPSPGLQGLALRTDCSVNSKRRNWRSAESGVLK